jgi:hypothetical protein
MAKITDQSAPISLKSLHSVLLELTFREQKNIEQVLTVYRVKVFRCEATPYLYTYTLADGRF